MNLENLTPEQRAEELRKRLKTQTAKFVPPPPPVPPEDIPDIGISKSSEDLEIDQVIASIDIVEAYTRFIGKSTPKVSSKTEGIMISCPLPTHPDKNPSAWINSEKKTWFCGGCQLGGDIYDLAAIKYGFDLSSYKSKENFPKLRRQLASEYGFKIVKGLHGKVYIQPPPEKTSEPSTNGQVLSLVKKQDDEEIPETFRIDWESLVPKDTFLFDWMEACTVDDLPHEYYFWLGLQAIAFTARRNVWLKDSPNVHPNLFICLYGSTGVGKSRSLRPYLELLRSVLPFTGDKDKYNDPQGIRVIPTPNSAEALLDSFAFEVLDPSTNNPSYVASVSGLLKVEEFAAFVARASRPGSTLKDMLIDLYDCHPVLTSHSRGKGRTVAKDPFCQVVTTTQPKAIHAFLRRTDTESGFLNRWIIAAGRPRKAPISYGSIKIDLTNAETKFRDLTVFTSATTEYSLYDDAFQVWDDFFQANIAGFKTGVKDMDTMASRIDLTLKKIITLFTINEQQAQPTASIVERATQLFQYLVAAYGTFGQDIIFSEVSDCQEKILACIKRFETKHKKFPTRRDILRGLGSKFDSETQVKAFRYLSELELIKEIAPTKEHATTRYSYADV